MFGLLYIKFSTRSHCRAAMFAALLPDETTKPSTGDASRAEPVNMDA